MPQPGFYDALRAHFTRAIPHATACGMEAGFIDAAQANLSLPYRDTWLADAERGLLHPAVITTLVDTASGLAVMAAAGQFERIATIDLRMDYLRPALAPKALHCRAECYRKTATIAFVRATAWQDDPAEPCAVSQSAFMRMPLKGGAA
jgi:uncharacterized protein (TIGR00369 family)